MPFDKTMGVPHARTKYRRHRRVTEANIHVFAHMNVRFPSVLKSFTHFELTFEHLKAMNKGHGAGDRIC